jgi:murein hydrolase activator
MVLWNFQYLRIIRFPVDMKGILLIVSILLGLSYPGTAQTRKELEDQRKKTLDEITYVDNLLKSTTKQRTAGVNDLKIIVNRIALRESVITGIRSEIDLLNYRISLNNLSISLMEGDLVELREEYAGSIRLAYKASRGYHPAILIFSAKDYNQGYKRLKYIQQSAKFRRRQAEIISDIVNEISDSKKRLEADRNKLGDLKSREENQKRILETEQQRKARLVKELQGKEVKLQQDLQAKRKVAARIQTEINKIIEEEKKKAVKTELTPEEKLTGSDFAGNKGKLPWPVERGVITSKFGKQKHAVLKNVTDDNIGIEITSSGNTPVRAVFRGEVARVFGISGANMAIIIRHGTYMTVYQDVINVRVKPGDKVDTKQVIADLFIEKESGNTGVLKFMVFLETKRLDPELWIAGKN